MSMTMIVHPTVNNVVLAMEVDTGSVVSMSMIVHPTVNNVVLAM